MEIKSIIDLSGFTGTELKEELEQIQDKAVRENLVTCYHCGDYCLEERAVKRNDKFYCECCCEYNEINFEV